MNERNNIKIRIKNSKNNLNNTLKVLFFYLKESQNLLINCMKSKNIELGFLIRTHFDNDDYQKLDNVILIDDIDYLLETYK
ncbi:hypothetical protein MFERI13461_00689 [Mycoplasma feriruminatoris]|uniref:Uncharacterized protein n=1 Tax=Mycoplasma feriruminatoris TaxID=1179777 RepID=A0A654IPS4_9MOLU|nr:hypothetical protein MFERI13461_00689 [Mycoplasma feriruminatoris]WFQ95422.1 hypothetical protein MFERI15407_00682 [Mycoplasma feriruminatoris]VZS00756.1 hypothetical protein MF5582_00758 [Mycoplasma feriruminatoris]